MSVRRGRHRIAAAAAAVAAAVGLVALAGCSTAPREVRPGATTAASGSATGLTGTLTVFAAASLTGAFDELTADFAAQHPGVDVRPVTYDGSSTLATQLVEGARADVFASADEATMATVDDAGLVDGAPTLFATNTLQIAVPAGNPELIASVADLAVLASSGGRVVLCAAQVPCGAASQEVLASAGVTLTPASEEQSVTAVLTKVAAGEADAGLVYRTDVLAAGDDVEGVDVDEAATAVNRYPIAVLGTGSRSSQDAVVAQAFVDLVLSDAGRQVLADRGFVTP
ncbi:molybdate ABC transporter substrate-binding protein [Cellulomonas fimi]|uniref:molybdate ABC transporter substrate-binding protein n=1 Tax=Cellulomonas fimi TaxID=1708 RepID=UPI00234C6520|nr:molybdate ABC transporter substrate-binding protein [Cellulomonas fimi]MDC7122038.1 molybdate ABC transporter substrate-binding protein [Cellulomonas fimi]